MAVVHLKCPHCLAMAQLRVIGVSVFPRHPQHGMQEILVSLGTVCPGCHKPVAVLARRTGRGESNPDIMNFMNSINHLVASQHPIDASNLVYVDHWPKPEEPAVPEHVPDAVARAFLQAERNYPLEGHEEAAGSMYRRSLEVGLSIAYPNLKGTLAQRIKELVETRILTSELGQWADGIRLIGNDAAHAEEVTRADLKMARGFTDAVLRYIFTLPEQVKMHAAANAPVVAPKAKEGN